MGVRQQTPPNLIGQQSPEFSKSAFDAAIWNKGFNIIIESAIECPCKSENNTNLLNCSNCLGTGWLFVNPIESKAIMHSINKNTEYKDWSQELLGTASCTVMDVDKLGFMDRITLKNVVSTSSPVNNTSIFTEVKQIRVTGVNKFIFLSYKPTEVESVFIYTSPSAKLTKLPDTAYNVKNDNGYVLELNYTFPSVNFNGSVSVRYKHNLQYHVLDIPHDTRNSQIKNSSGKQQQIILPINAIVRRAHEVLTVPDYSGDNIQDNSWL